MFEYFTNVFYDKYILFVVSKLIIDFYLKKLTSWRPTCVCVCVCERERERERERDQTNKKQN